MRLLGGLEIEGVPPAALGSRKARTLVTVLALGRGAPVPLDRIVEALWAGQPPARAGDQVRVLVSRARAALGTARVPRRDAGWALLRERELATEPRLGRHPAGGEGRGVPAEGDCSRLAEPRIGRRNPAESRRSHPESLGIGRKRCLLSALAQPGGEALGNQVPESTWRRLFAEAGYSRFRRATETRSTASPRPSLSAVSRIGRAGVAGARLSAEGPEIRAGREWEDPGMSDEEPPPDVPDPTSRAAELGDAIADTEDTRAEILEEAAADLGDEDQRRRAEEARGSARRHRERADDLRENPLPESSG